MKKKDVVFLCQFFYPEYISSATLPFDTAKALAENGFSVDVYCGYPKEYNDSQEKVPYKESVEGINIKRLRYMQLSRANFLGRLINYFSFTFSVLMHLFSFKKYETMIVYSNPPVLPLIAYLCTVLFKTKVVFVSYDVYPEIALNTNALKEGSIISRVMTMINHILFPRLTKVVALSTEMKDYLANNRKLDQEALEVIPNWFASDVEYSNKRDVHNPLFDEWLQEGDVVISYLGNMGIAQDMESVVQLMQKFEGNDKVHFLLAGHGNKVNNLKETVGEFGLKNTHFYDFLKGKDYRDALSVSDFFIVTLEESLNGLCVPSKTYSYLSAGKPVIAFMNPKSDIVKDLVKSEAGFGGSKDDIDVIKNKVEEIVHNSTLVEMGSNARRLFESKYTEKKCTNMYIEMMETIIVKSGDEKCLETKHY